MYRKVSLKEWNQHCRTSRVEITDPSLESINRDNLVGEIMFATLTGDIFSRNAIL